MKGAPVDAAAEACLELPVDVAGGAGAFGAEHDGGRGGRTDVGERRVGVVFEHRDVDQVDFATLFGEPAFEFADVPPRAQEALRRLGQTDHADTAVDNLRGPVALPAGGDDRDLIALGLKFAGEMGDDGLRAADQRPKPPRDEHQPQLRQTADS